MDSPTPSVTGEDRLWGALAHLSAFAMYFTGIGHIVGPMIIWLWKRDTSAFAGEEGKEALNFSISIFIYALVCGILCITIIWLLFVHLALYLLAAFHVICVVIAGLKSYEGRHFRYPLNLRLIK